MDPLMKAQELTTMMRVPFLHRQSIAFNSKQANKQISEQTVFFPAVITWLLSLPLRTIMNDQLAAERQAMTNCLKQSAKWDEMLSDFFLSRGLFPAI